VLLLQRLRPITTRIARSLYEVHGYFNKGFIQTFVRYVFQIITSNIFKINFPFTTKLYINNNRAKLGLIPPDKLYVTIHLLPFKLA
ncbi:hypothetical protein, partial [Priestia megaterium]|uniref:hypothetical protein n=1 Tax=Priestia megaterium TaxID=1404 RepID=UPI003000DCBD